MVSGPAGGSRAFSESSCAGLPFLWADHDEGSLVYGSENCSVMPCREFLFGTDTMGRDIFSMIWYGGRISLAIGLLSTLISTVIAVLFGAVSGCAPAWLDALLMRLTEIFLSVPNLLLVIFLLAAAGKSNVITISAVIGMTSWTSIAKVVRTEVRQIRNSEYVIASRCMGGSFFYIYGTIWHRTFFRLLCLWWL